MSLRSRELISGALLKLLVWLTINKVSWCPRLQDQREEPSLPAPRVSVSRITAVRGHYYPDHGLLLTLNETFSGPKENPTRQQGLLAVNILNRLKPEWFFHFTFFHLFYWFNFTWVGYNQSPVYCNIWNYVHCVSEIFCGNKLTSCVHYLLLCSVLLLKHP